MNPTDYLMASPSPEGGLSSTQPKATLWKPIFSSLLVHGAALALVTVLGQMTVKNGPTEILMVDLNGFSPVEYQRPAKVIQKVVPLKAPKPTAAPEPAHPKAQAVEHSPAAAEVSPLPVQAKTRTSSGIPENAAPPAPPASALTEEKPGHQQQAVYVPTTTMAPQTSTPQSSMADSRGRYQTLLRSLVEKYKDYPLFARKAGLEGSCLVRCVLARNGSVLRLEILRSSNFSQLDNAALRAFKSVGKFPPAPEEIGGEEIVCDLLVVFRLTGK